MIERIRAYDADAWRILILAKGRHRPDAVTAHTVRNTWHTSSSPVRMTCSDGSDYVVKGAQNGRMVFNDHCIGRLGNAAGFPVPRVAFVDVPAALIAADPVLANCGMSAGLAHGSRVEESCTERAEVDSSYYDANAQRFCDIAALYGWTCAEDPQLIYGLAAPHLVYSADHGHFFPGGPNWTASGLLSVLPATLHPYIMGTIPIDKGQRRDTLDRLRQVTDSTIAWCVGICPDEWLPSMDDRVAVAMLLSRRLLEIRSAL